QHCALPTPGWHDISWAIIACSGSLCFAPLFASLRLATGCSSIPNLSLCTSSSHPVCTLNFAQPFEQVATMRRRKRRKLEPVLKRRHSGELPLRRIIWHQLHPV